MRMCSKRKAPTGMIPVRECNRRKMNEVPCPARRGGTPCTAPRVLAGAVELTAEATNAPYKFLLVQKWKKNFVLSAQPTRQVKKWSPRSCHRHTISGNHGTQRRGDCSGIFLRPLALQMFFRSAENKIADHSRSRSFLSERSRSSLPLFRKM